jgi:hypothetical protein
MTTQRTISASELRDHMRTVINEVYYGQAEYLVVKFGQTAQPGRFRTFAAGQTAA